MVFRNLPETVRQVAPDATELARLAESPTSKAVVGVLATRCAFGVTESVEEDGVDLYHCEDRSNAGVPIASPFAVACLDTDGLSSELEGQSLVGRLNDLLRDQDLHKRPVVVAATTGSARVAAAMEYTEPHFSPIELGEVVAMLLARPPRAKLVAFLVQHTPLRRLNPYTYKGPIRGGMFVGRESELETLCSFRSSRALIGPRASGKSSLVHRAIGEIKNRGEMAIGVEFGAAMQQRTLLREVFHRFIREYGAAEHLIHRPTLNTLLRLVEDYAFTYRKKVTETDGKRQAIWTTQRRHQIALFIDEADELLTKCPALCEALRHCHNEGWIRVVLVGYKKLRQAIGDTKTSPLMNVCEQMHLANLSLEECGQLVTDPMIQLGIGFEGHHEVVHTIHRESGGSPSRVQLLCQYIIDALGATATRVVTPELARDAVQLPQVRKILTQWYHDSTTPVEKWLTSYAAFVLPLEEAPFRVKATHIFPRLTRQHFDGVFTDLLTANVLDYLPDGRVDFTFPALRGIAKPDGELRDASRHATSRTEAGRDREMGPPPAGWTPTASRCTAVPDRRTGLVLKTFPVLRATAGGRPPLPDRSQGERSRGPRPCRLVTLLIACPPGVDSRRVGSKGSTPP